MLKQGVNGSLLSVVGCLGKRFQRIVQRWSLEIEEEHELAGALWRRSDPAQLANTLKSPNLHYWLFVSAESRACRERIAWDQR